MTKESEDEKTGELFLPESETEETRENRANRKTAYDGDKITVYRHKSET